MGGGDGRVVDAHVDEGSVAATDVAAWSLHSSRAVLMLRTMFRAVFPGGEGGQIWCGDWCARAGVARRSGPEWLAIWAVHVRLDERNIDRMIIN